MGGTMAFFHFLPSIIALLQREGHHLGAKHFQRPHHLLVGHAGMAPLFGTPEVVRERLSLAQEQGINRIFSQFGFPGVPHKKVMRALEMFGTKVMPHFREQPATVAD